MTPLLTTKLYRPALRADRVPRPRLLAHLDRSLEPDRRLALVAAPAGYGKTTMVAAWAQRQIDAGGPNVAWLSLDVDDNTLARFLRYLIAATQRVAPEVGERSLTMLAAPEPVPADVIVTALINDAAQMDARIVLVLDDYHNLANQEIQSAMTFFVEHLPPLWRTVLITRTDPPLPLHRWRARRQLVEVRAGDLRFTIDETATFLTHSDAPALLDDEDVAALAMRTEGWPVGLHLASLALRERANANDAKAFVRSFSGSHRYVLDYLLEEVVNHQSPWMQRFLLATSILERLTAPLCDAVMSWDAGEAPVPGKARKVLARLERENLFLVPLDENRTWFRYHHLFAELLRVRLHQYARAMVPSYHRRAAAWLADNDLPMAAVRHALAAEDLDDAADLVEAHTHDFLAQGDLAEALAWIERLPETLIAERPWLAVQKAWAMAFAGAATVVERHLAMAEAHREALPEQAKRRLDGHMTGIRAFVAVAMGDAAKALALAERAAALLPARDAWAHSVMAWSRGYIYRMTGALSRAEPAFRKVIACGERLDNVWTLVTGYTELCLLLRAQGRLTEALNAGERGLSIAQPRQGRIPGYVGRLESAMASVWLERNALDEAQRHADAGIEQTQWWQNPNHIIYAHLIAARIQRARGDGQAAGAALAHADAVKTQRAVVPILPALQDQERVALWLNQGDVTAARAWAASREQPDDERLNASNMIAATRALTLARVYLADGQPARARSWLDRIVDEAGEQRDLWLKAQVWRARALQNLGEQQTAVEALRAAVAFAAPEAYLRPFLDAGKSLADLLLNVDGAEHAYAMRILAALGASEPAQSGVASEQAPDRTGALVEPLTDREHEVLTLMAAGRTNPEIAEALVIATGTVKAYTAHIYRKLDVHNRTEAAARARELSLL